MQNLEIHNPYFLTYSDTLFVIDVLGRANLQQIEKNDLHPAGNLQKLLANAHHA
jgi:hypothetical protein